jgi:hypothetical protein
MRSTPPPGTPGQLILFPGIDVPAGAPAPAARTRRRAATPVARKAERLDQMARAAEREMAESYRAGDMIGAGAARDRALGARRAAELLRAGPRGVADVLGGRHEAA